MTEHPNSVLARRHQRICRLRAKGWGWRSICAALRLSPEEYRAARDFRVRRAG
jgi:hypothetical protein